ncbi:MAG: tetratricopeptide repeat protein [Spirulina sp. SIO3F2]|nr:tetratricopeptide repeat protein [Spirulina sp. SIO3F2]
MAQAAEYYRAGLAMLEELGQIDDDVKLQQGLFYSDLGDVLIDMRDWAGARSAYETSLALAQERSGVRSTAIVKGKLGNLAIKQDDLKEAAKLYQEVLFTFQQLGEPLSEAKTWHQLGVIYGKAQQWEAAEHHYREAARLWESQGDSAGTATTWHQLAIVNQRVGQIEVAKAWYEKTAEVFRQINQPILRSTVLTDLAMLLQSQPHPSSSDLTTAHQYAKAALEIWQTFDPTAAEIWKIYKILVEIAEKQGLASEERIYRQKAKVFYVKIQYGLQKFTPSIRSLILGTVMAVNGDVDALEKLETAMQSAPNSATKLIETQRRILEGERDEATLMGPLDFEDSMIIHAILQGIADPTTLQALLGEDE